MKIRDQIYQRLVADAESCQFPAPWEEIPCHKAFVRLPTDMTSTLDKLRCEFEESDLIEAGILVTTAPGEAMANPQLTEYADFVFAPRHSGKVGLIVVGLKALGIDTWSVAEMLAYSGMGPLFSKISSQVFIVFSAADLALLWSLGFPAISHERLACLGGEELDMFCRALRLRRPAASNASTDVEYSQSRSPQPFFPVLVNWCPATLDLTDRPEAQAVEEHLSKLSQFLRVDLSGGGIWKPTEIQLETIKFRLQYGSPAEVFEALVKSATKNRSPLSGSNEKPMVPAEAYVAARGDWQKACRERIESRQSLTWDVLQRQQEKTLIAPLIKQGQTESDPLSQNLSVTLAEVSDVFHTHASFMGVKLSTHIRDHGLKMSGQLPPGDFRQLDTLASHILSLTEGVHSCRVNNKKKAFKLSNKKK